MDDIIFKVNLEHDTFISVIIIDEKEVEEGPMSESPLYKIIQKVGIYRKGLWLHGEVKKM